MNWDLVGRDSQISFASIKQGDISERHNFKDISGGVSSSGGVNIDIALASVNTNIDLRDERMREHLFQTETFPTANLRTQINFTDFETLSLGQRKKMTLGFDLSLHGAENEVEGDIYITRIHPDRVLVETIGPVFIHIDDYGLTEGINTLRNLASLDTITPSIPVTASLIFERN